MLLAAVVYFSSPGMGIAGSALGLAAIIVARARKVAVGHISAALLLIGIVLLSLAAAGPIWRRQTRGSLAVMVDLSPSTRGAQFRDSASLRRRIGELIGNQPFQLIEFAGTNQAGDLSAAMKEIPCDQTVFSPAAADAIVLFSDARFDVPSASPPVYVVLDQGLEDVADASVQRLELRGPTLAATIANAGPPRQAVFTGTSEATTAPVDAGSVVISRPLQSGATAAEVRLNPADLWPENDQLDIRVSPPAASQRWWIGANSPGGDWRHFSTSDLPGMEQDYLAPAVIVLDNEPAGNFSPPQLDLLEQYVRDLGGALLILGGDQSLAAGGYEGTPLAALSPLAVSPPQPTMRWVLLVDSSGSMAEDVTPGISRWQIATSAVVGLLPDLPPADVAQVGQFSDQLRWWSVGRSVRDTAALPLPPADATPHGPTNLESVLNQIADETDSGQPTQLLLLSDCDTRMDHPDELSRYLQQKKISLHVLALAQGSALETIRHIAGQTGGKVVQQLDPSQWSRSVDELTQAAMPRRLMHQPIDIQFVNDAKSLSNDSAIVWNRAWLKPEAQLWAHGTATDGDVPMAAWRRFGDGCVVATTFTPATATVDALVRLIVQRPRDPRFSVQWQMGRKIRVTVDAIERGKFINGISASLQVDGDAGRQTIAISQTGPGEYEAALDAPLHPIVATVRAMGEVIDRISIAGRYPPEFDAVGNDHAAMQLLAERSGGAMIWPSNHGPIDFRWPRREESLATWICALALVFLVAGLVAAKRASAS